MTKLLDRAIEAIQELPADQQDELARMLLDFMGNDEVVYELSPEEQASLRKSLDQAEKREFASPERIEAIWSKYPG